MLSKIARLFALGVFLFASLFHSSWANEKQITLLHTNDLHSQFRPDQSPLSLGGLSRIKTLVDGVRASTPHVLLIDGGDWSEGSIYYTEGAGTEALRLMDRIGYDVAVVGNHDWLNGPDFLLNAIRGARPKFSLIGANLDSQTYLRSKEFRSQVLPYVIKEVGGVRIAFVGLLTYNFVFDSYFSPIRLSDPFNSAIHLARELKKSVDLVVGVSHNVVDTNLKILKAVPEMDGIIGAHDHRQLNQPIWVERPGCPPSWIVEAGFHGRFLGRIDLQVNSQKKVSVKNYRLIQVDRTIPEDPEVNWQIEQIERIIERKMGDVFDDHLGESEVETSREGIESSSGALTTNAFHFAVPNADGAMDHPNFIYSSLHEGPIRSADAFNIHPGVYQPDLGKTWNLHLLSIRGKTLMWLLNLGGSFGGILKEGRFLSFSGIQATWKELSGGGLSFSEPGQLVKDFQRMILSDSQSSFQDVLVHGSPLDPERVYRFVVSYGVIEGIRFVNSLIPGLISVEELKDTGIEAWKAIASYVQKKRVITLDSLRLGSRLRTREVDLGFHYNDIRWMNIRGEGRYRIADVEVTVHNYGLKESRADSTALALFENSHGADGGVDPKYTLIQSKKVQSLKPGAVQKVVFRQVHLKEDRGVYPVTIQIFDPFEAETNTLNNQATHWFSEGER